jgi:hypothetical protein
MDSFSISRAAHAVRSVYLTSANIYSNPGQKPSSVPFKGQWW